MIRPSWRRGALLAALLGFGGCAQTQTPRYQTPRYGDTGPDELVLVDARCTRSEDCTVVDAWAGDPCYCNAAWRAANVDFARRWNALRYGPKAEKARSQCRAQCGAMAQPPELALCISAQCIAIRRNEVDLLHTQLAPYRSAPLRCPESPTAP